MTDRAIYRYPLEGHHAYPITVTMPVGARPLHAYFSGSRIVVYAEVDNDMARRVFTFHLVGTGTVVPKAAGRYLNTVEADGCTFHVYWSESA